MAYNPRRRRSYRRRVCAFCHNRELALDYKNIDLLKRFVAESGKIDPRRMTGTCYKHQRQLAREIKRARNVALLPFVNT